MKKKRIVLDKDYIALDSPEDYYTIEKISENMYTDNRGYLILTDVVFARTGSMKYHSSENGMGGDCMWTAYRNEDEVFSDKAMKSYENAPLTDRHPQGHVTSENYKQYEIGHVRNVKKLDRKDKFGNLLVGGEVIVKDKKIIEEIRNGDRRHVSAGYTHSIKNVDYEKKTYEMTDIKINHLALVGKGLTGRAETAIINDESYKNTNIYEICDLEVDDMGSNSDKEYTFKKDNIIYNVNGCDSKEEAKQLVIQNINERKSKGKGE